MNSLQKQKIGNNSQSIQAGRDVNNGISYQDARLIAQDVFKANALELAGIASQLAENRVREFIEEYLDRVFQLSPEFLKSLTDPDLQYALFEAQKSYARRGNKELCGILMDILVDRTANQSQNTLQIVLNESITAASKLENHHFSILALVFILRYTNSPFTNPQEFFSYLKRATEPFIGDVPNTAAPYRHLQYVSCASISMGSVNLERLFKSIYGRFFSKGFEKQNLVDLGLTSQQIDEIVIPCINDRSKYQFKFSGEDEFNRYCEGHSKLRESVGKIKSVQEKNLMCWSEMADLIRPRYSGIDLLAQVWNETTLCYLDLTSVGIAIGHAKIRRTSGIFFDLSVWVH